MTNAQKAARENYAKKILRVYFELNLDDSEKARTQYAEPNKAAKEMFKASLREGGK